MKPAIIEKNINIFDSPTNSNLGHCVSSDFKMTAGIAKEFRDKFNNVHQLKEQNPEL